MRSDSQTVAGHAAGHVGVARVLVGAGALPHAETLSGVLGPDHEPVLRLDQHPLHRCRQITLRRRGTEHLAGLEGIGHSQGPPDVARPYPGDQPVVGAVLPRDGVGEGGSVHDPEDRAEELGGVKVAARLDAQPYARRRAHGGELHGCARVAGIVERLIQVLEVAPQGLRIALQAREGVRQGLELRPLVAWQRVIQLLGREPERELRGTMRHRRTDLALAHESLGERERRLAALAQPQPRIEIGRASCRERV